MLAASQSFFRLMKNAEKLLHVFDRKTRSVCLGLGKFFRRQLDKVIGARHHLGY